VTNRAEAENCFKLLPLSLLALRIQKVDPDAGHDGHSHGKQKRVKCLWTVQVVQQQDAADDMHYMWLYEGPQWKKKLYAIGALAAVMTLVMFPLWPLVMRKGVWYLSMGMLGLLALFFVMAIFRMILFAITMFTHPPGLWLYPNLFEDVGFFDSFRPVWAWHEVGPFPTSKLHNTGANSSRTPRRSANSDVRSEQQKQRRHGSRLRGHQATRIRMEKPSSLTQAQPALTRTVALSSNGPNTPPSRRATMNDLIEGNTWFRKLYHHINMHSVYHLHGDRR
jgi:translocation protein SEC62